MTRPAERPHHEKANRLTIRLFTDLPVGTRSSAHQYGPRLAALALPYRRGHRPRRPLVTSDPVAIEPYHFLVEAGRRSLCQAVVRRPRSPVPRAPAKRPCRHQGMLAKTGQHGSQLGPERHSRRPSDRRGLRQGVLVVTQWNKPTDCPRRLNPNYVSPVSSSTVLPRQHRSPRILFKRSAGSGGTLPLASDFHHRCVETQNDLPTGPCHGTRSSSSTSSRQLEIDRGFRNNAGPADPLRLSDQGHLGGHDDIVTERSRRFARRGPPASALSRRRPAMRRRSVHKG